MTKEEQNFNWNELKEIWVNSSQTHHIHLQVDKLIEELKSKGSKFERDSIKSDIATLKTNWSRAKGVVSQFEKDSINKDLKYMTGLLKQFFNLFKKN
jgi:septation ring formation regulator EzrA